MDALLEQQKRRRLDRVGEWKQQVLQPSVALLDGLLDAILCIGKALDFGHRLGCLLLVRICHVGICIIIGSCIWVRGLAVRPEA